METDGTKRDLENTRGDLLALRKEHGADSPIGHCCTNLLELTERYEKETDREARKNILATIERNKTRLERLLR